MVVVVPAALPPPLIKLKTGVHHSPLLCQRLTVGLFFYTLQ